MSFCVIGPGVLLDSILVWILRCCANFADKAAFLIIGRAKRSDILLTISSDIIVSVRSAFFPQISCSVLKMTARIYLPKSAVILTGVSGWCAPDISPSFRKLQTEEREASLRRLISDSGTDRSNWIIEKFWCQNLKTDECFRYNTDHVSSQWEKYEKLSRHNRKQLKRWEDIAKQRRMMYLMYILKKHAVPSDIVHIVIHNHKQNNYQE